MSFIGKAKSETLRMWQRKCYKLEKENERLKGELAAIQKYKDDYEEQLASLKVIKKHYQEMDKHMDVLYETAKQELDQLLGLTKETVER